MPGPRRRAVAIMTGLPAGKSLVIGLGSGRSGTASLTSLINRQDGGICFHEMNPSSAVFAGNPQPHINAVAEFRSILCDGPRKNLSIDYSRPASVATYRELQAMPEVNLIGDIAFYYLSYVETLLAVEPACKFVCLRRDRQQTVDSWMKKSAIGRWRSLWLADRLKALLTRTPFHTEYNYWQEHDGSVWKKDPVWDSAFPKFDAPGKREAIEQYWDYYYLEADRLARALPGSFRIFDIGAMSHADGQRDILEFIGVPAERMVCGDSVHLHRSG